MKKLLFQKNQLGTGGSRLGLSTNDKITVENLLYGLMMVSGNDAAVSLAEFIGGNIESFSNLMNEKALNLHLESTHFTSPHGLDQDEHYTTAYDLALLTNYALQNNLFLKIVKTQNYTVYINNKPKQINNTNELLGYLDGIYGVKTGFTNGANRCLVTACKRGDLDIICVVLGCDTKKDRTKDSIYLINYIFNNFSIVNIKDLIQKEFNKWNTNNTNTFTINKGLNQNLIPIYSEAQLPYENIAVRNSDISNIKINIVFDTYFDAPILYEDKIGLINVYITDNTYFSLDILSSNTIKRKNILYYINMFIKDYFSLLTF